MLNRLCLTQNAVESCIKNKSEIMCKKYLKFKIDNDNTIPLPIKEALISIEIAVLQLNTVYKKYEW